MLGFFLWKWICVKVITKHKSRQPIVRVTMWAWPNRSTHMPVEKTRTCQDIEFAGS